MRVIQPSAFNVPVPLVDGIAAPGNASADELLAWARGLTEPDDRTAWLGLPRDAELQRLAACADATISHARRLIDACAPLSAGSAVRTGPVA